MPALPELNAREDILPPAHKPAFLRRVVIEGYKSIAHCDVTLEPLTVFVGRNASGKSNFLDALGFLQDLTQMRVSDAVRERGGWKVIADRTGEGKRIKFCVEFLWNRGNKKLIANYEVCIEPGNNLNLAGEVVEESLLFSENSSRSGWGFKRIFREFQRHGDWNASEIPDFEVFFSPMKEVSNYYSDVLFANTFCRFAFKENIDILPLCCVFNFLPSEMRKHQVAGGRLTLRKDGSNLARAIAGLNELDPNKIERIKTYLKMIVPGVVDFWKADYGDQETVRFAMQSDEGASRFEFDAQSMSDGTLRVLAALVAVSQSFLPEGDPGFVAIEEPETAIHPAALHALMDAMDEATLHTQVLLTTHSTEILDSPVIRPENIRVVRLIDGHTVIGELDGGSVEIVRQNLDTLGGLERQNQLDIDESIIANGSGRNSVNGRRLGG